MYRKSYPVKREKIINELKAKSFLANGCICIECFEARVIAKKFEINGANIGKLCDEEKIKIISCELGCF